MVVIKVNINNITHNLYQSFSLAILQMSNSVIVVCVGHCLFVCVCVYVCVCVCVCACACGDQETILEIEYKLCTIACNSGKSFKNYKNEYYL